MIDLGTLGGTYGGAGGLNNRGQVVGQSSLAEFPGACFTGEPGCHAFLWDHGRLQDLGTLGGSFSTANAINENGEIIGGGTTAGDLAFHAFLWMQGSFTDLGTVGGGDCSSAFGINSKTQVVGQSFDCANPVLGQRAFLWENGSIIDLNVFVPPGSDLTLTEVEQINDRGEMFGIGTRANGEDRAFLLIPCQEGEEGCIDASESPPVALQNELLITKSPAQPGTPTAIAAWRTRLARRHQIPGLWTPKD
jgi:probable HAF family extracellular repeat protein